ncbi:putative reverse transcriptase domain-containing protein [Tanacetum coccineum]
MSSAEAEYVDAAGCCANILWMKSQLTNSDIIYEKRSYSLRDIELHFIPTQYLLADIFTKPLDEPTFKRLIVELGATRTLKKRRLPSRMEMSRCLGSTSTRAVFLDIRQMVTTRRNSDDDVPNFEAMITAAVANALPNLTAALRTQITNDIRNGVGPSGGGGGGDAIPQGIHVWIERFTKLKPLAFRYFPASEQQRYEREYGSICQLDRENSGEYMELVAAAARNIELLHESGNSNKRDRDGNRIQNRGQGQQENKSRYDQGSRSEGHASGSEGQRRSTGVKDCPQGKQKQSMPADFARLPPTIGRVYATTRDQAAKTSGTITGILYIDDRTVFVLFDTGATHSIISTTFAKKLNMTPTPLIERVIISTLMKNHMLIDHEYVNYPLRFDDRVRPANLLLIHMFDFDVILGMDWLASHRATIDCYARTVIFGNVRQPEFVYHGSSPLKSVKLISAMKARTLISHGCQGFLASVMDTSLESPNIENLSVVREFADVFPDELPGLPPAREIEFGIELIPGAEPISKAPYRMAPVELKELKEQLQRTKINRTKLSYLDVYGTAITMDVFRETTTHSETYDKIDDVDVIARKLGMMMAVAVLSFFMFTLQEMVLNEYGKM